MDITAAIGNKPMNKDSMTSSILIKINGENKSTPQDSSILNLLDIYKINKDRVVIELNKLILEKDKYGSTKLNNNDEIEIVTFVGGG